VTTPFDPLDLASRRALFFARRALSELGGHSIEPEHLLLGLLEEPPDVVSSVLEPPALARMIGELQERVTEARTLPENVEVPLSKAVENILQKSIEEAGGTAAPVVRPDHLLLGLLSAGAGAAAILVAYGISAAEVRRRLSSSDSR